VEDTDNFDREFGRVVAWAANNRQAIQAAAERVLGPLEVLDLPHNSFEKASNGGVIIRKGCGSCASWRPEHHPTSCRRERAA
jgi:hypothetical protein